MALALAVGGLQVGSLACATAASGGGADQATPAGCAAARLAREWTPQEAPRVAGCFEDEAGILLGTIVLFDVLADTRVSGADEPQRFALGTVDGPLPYAWWELLGRGLVRLSFPDQSTLSANRGGVERLNAANACLAFSPGVKPADDLDGVVYAVADVPPFAGPTTVTRLRRRPCPQ